ncbi:hypothetical protein J2847_003465 [Azospirillum agricola]|uniref:GIY-YIG nuclease family protein n=1 Tax=Azospirillum agricola TaxID=1720247 RepID=UPI001AE7CA95|nr:GIY-YIG nuclease family protein [Azospirillum agricola]MBP2230162.1 hypothetical protein [Azospirillum agricola]
MTNDDRKAAVAAYKERTAPAGIYALRCAASGQVWVGHAPDLDTIGNRLWFTLRTGTDPHRDLQAAWTAHGAGSFSLETLERLEDEELPFARKALIRKRLAHWREHLGAAAL